MIIIALILILCLAIYSLSSKDLLHGILALSAVSLISALLFYILNAPDVAITEAAVGTGVTTVVFLGVIRHTDRKDTDK